MDTIEQILWHNSRNTAGDNCVLTTVLADIFPKQNIETVRFMHLFVHTLRHSVQMPYKLYTLSRKSYYYCQLYL